MTGVRYGLLCVGIMTIMFYHSESSDFSSLSCEQLVNKSYHGFSALMVDVAYIHWLMNTRQFPDEQDMMQLPKLFPIRITANILFDRYFAQAQMNCTYPRSQLRPIIEALQEEYPEVADAHDPEFRNFYGTEIPRVHAMWTHNCANLQDILLEQEKRIDNGISSTFVAQETDLFMRIVKAYASVYINEECKQLIKDISKRRVLRNSQQLSKPTVAHTLVSPELLYTSQ
ncbi:MAG: hypothetical protein WCE21_02545 [Candidatus Babeliales bacterium]